MVKTEANLIRTTAAICQDALKTPGQLRAIGAGRERIQQAEANSLNAGNLLRMAILRWLKTL